MPNISQIATSLKSLTLATSLASAEVKEAKGEQTELMNETVRAQVDGLGKKVEANIAEAEEQAKLYEDMRKMIQDFTPQQFEDWKQDFEDIGEVRGHKEMLELAAQEYIEALRPTIKGHKESLAPLKQAVKDTPKDNPNREAVVAAYREALAKGKALETRYNYFVDIAGKIMVAREEGETTAKDRELIAERAETAAEKAETAAEKAETAAERAQTVLVTANTDRVEAENTLLLAQKKAVLASLRGTIVSNTNQ